MGSANEKHEKWYAGLNMVLMHKQSPVPVSYFQAPGLSQTGSTDNLPYTQP